MKDQNSLPIGDQFINSCVLIMLRVNKLCWSLLGLKGLKESRLYNFGLIITITKFSNLIGHQLS